MTVCTGFRLFCTLVGVMSIILLLIDIPDILPTKTEGRSRPLQEQRKQHLRDVCDTIKDFPNWNRSIEDLSTEELSSFIVDDKHEIVYCYIPKVACTNWKRVMIVLRLGEPYRDPMLLDGHKIHGSSIIKYLRNDPRKQMKAKLDKYTKFLFVRHPFVRLISAYRNKLQGYTKSFYERYGQLMLRRYGNMPNPPQTEEAVVASGVQPSFHHFIQYLLDPRTERPLNIHWRPMYQLCHPCFLEYDFIGHLETINEDAAELLKMLKLDKIEFPHAYPNVTTGDTVADWFKPVSIEERRKLYHMYEMDFKLFGYPKPDELLGG